MKKHWYFIYIRECAVCGHSTEERVRRYGRKPKTPTKRYEHVQTACVDHFL